MTCNTDLETQLHDFGERIYRILEYRKLGLFTPYEVENKFSDDSEYELADSIEYYKLSEIKLERFDYDQNELCYRKRYFKLSLCC